MLLIAPHMCISMCASLCFLTTYWSPTSFADCAAETTLSPAQWDLMNTIRCSGETLLTLITDILDFSRIEADKMVLSPTEFHLQTVIEAAMEIAGLHAAQKRLQVCDYI